MVIANAFSMAINLDSHLKEGLGFQGLGFRGS